MLQRSDYNEQYYNGNTDYGYTKYSRDTYGTENHNDLAIKFNDRLDLVGKKVLVIGCAYGYLVESLVTIGVDAYGIDFSDYAISQVPIEISKRVIVGDVRIESDLLAIKKIAEIEKFDVIIDEDMFSCLTDIEALNVSKLFLKHADTVVHLITDQTTKSEYYNFHSKEEWISLLGENANEKWYKRFN